MDFGGQEYKDETDILKFCRLTYSVKFPMYETTHAREGIAHPFFAGLATAADGSYPQWNFHKYLIGRDGKLVGEFSTGIKPLSIEVVGAIEDALDAK